MSTELIYERFMRALERYGWPVILSSAVLWFARTDLIIPMVEAHTHFLEELTASNREMAKTQVEISRLVEDQARTLEVQTHLLYTICPPGSKLPLEAREYAQALNETEETTN